MEGSPVKGNNVDSTDGNRRELERRCDELLAVGEKYDPFHETCGKNIVFRENRLIASRKTDYIDGGMVFSGKPVPLGEVFQIKLSEEETSWQGSLVSTPVVHLVR